MTEKKILTKEEKMMDWLTSEMEKDKFELEKQKSELIESIKKVDKKELVNTKKEKTLWEKIKKVLLT
jgi:hypothetical protein